MGFWFSARDFEMLNFIYCVIDLEKFRIFAIFILNYIKVEPYYTFANQTHYYYYLFIWNELLLMELSQIERFKLSDSWCQSLTCSYNFHALNSGIQHLLTCCIFIVTQQNKQCIRRENNRFVLWWSNYALNAKLIHNDWGKSNIYGILCMF